MMPRPLARTGRQALIVAWRDRRSVRRCGRPRERRRGLIGPGGRVLGRRGWAAAVICVPILVA